MSESLIEHRPWGYFQILLADDLYKVKKLVIKPGHRTSLQYHKYINKTWVVLYGNGLAHFTFLGNEYNLFPNVALSVLDGEAHRIHNTGSDDLIIIEVQIGSYLDEDDIIRLEDDYGRQ